MRSASASCKWCGRSSHNARFPLEPLFIVSMSASICGISLFDPSTAATCASPSGNVSFELCDLFHIVVRMQQLFSRDLVSAVSDYFTRVTILDCVPLPVCHTTSGKWSLSLPAATSSHAAAIAFFFFLANLAKVEIRDRRRFLQNSERMRDLTRHYFPADLKILQAALRLRPPLYLSAGTFIFPSSPFDTVFHIVPPIRY